MPRKTPIYVKENFKNLSLTSFYLMAVDLSICLSLSFLKTESLVFYDILPADPKLGFLPFLKFGLLVFLEFTNNDSLQQYLTSSRGKINEKNFGTQIWAKGAKVSSEARFFAIFSGLAH